MRVESGEQRGLSTSTILWIELGAACALIVSGIALSSSSWKLFAFGVMLSGPIVLGAVPITLGILWDSPRTSPGTKVFSILMLFSGGGGAITRFIYKYAFRHQQLLDSAGPFIVYMTAFILFLISYQTRRWLGSRAL